MKINYPEIEPEVPEALIEKMKGCALNLFLWNGNMDDKLKLEWRAAEILKKDTIVVAIGKTELPDRMKNSPLIKKVIHFDTKEDLKKEISNPNGELANILRTLAGLVGCKEKCERC